MTLISGISTEDTAPAGSNWVEMEKSDGTSVKVRYFNTSTLEGGVTNVENGKISPTVSGNNLTLTLQTLAGNNPSTTDPVYVWFSGVRRAVTAALSMTVNAGVNSFNAGSAELATKEIDYFAYMGYNATDGVTIGFSRIPYAQTYGEFSITNTNEKYIAAAIINNAASTDEYQVVGRFAATLSAGAGYTWTVPTYTAKNLVQRPIFHTRLLTWVPTWTNLTVGNGTITAEYQIDKYALEYHVEFVAGSTSTVGDVSHTLPMSKSANYESTSAAGGVYGTLRLQDSGVAGYLGVHVINNTTTCTYRTIDASGTYAKQAALSSTVPFTWGTGDGTYEWTRYFIH